MSSPTQRARSQATDASSEIEGLRAELAREIEANRRHRTLLRSIDAIVYEFDFTNNRFLFVNRIAETMLGYPLDEWYEPGFWQAHLHPDDRDAAIRECAECTEGGRDHVLEYRMVARDGRSVWLHDTVTVSRDPVGVVLLHGAMFDVTARKNAEAGVRDAGGRLNALLEGLALGVIFEDAAGRVEYVNDAVCRMLRWPSPDSVLGSTREEVVRMSAPILGDPEAFLAVVNEFVARGEVVFDEARPLVDGRWIERVYVPLKFDGVVRGHLWKLEDVSERRRAEDALRVVATATAAQTGDEFFRALVRNLSRALRVRWALVAEMTDDGARMRTLAVWSGDDFADDFEYELEGAPCAETMRDGIARVDGDLQRRNGGHAVVRALGAKSYLGVRLATSSNRAVGVLAVMHDDLLPAAGGARSILEIFGARAGIELERKYALAALSQSESEQRALLHAIPDRMFLLTADGTCLTSIDARRNRTSAARETLLGERMHDVLSPEVVQQLEPLLARTIATGETQVGEYRTTLDGQERLFEARLVVCGDDRVLCIARDITEQRRLEQQLVHAQRLESIGRLAGGIAHDFNNLLTGVLGFVELAELEASGQPKLLEYLSKVQTVAERASSLTQQLLAFARKQLVAPRVLSIETSIGEMQTFLSRVLGENLELAIHLDPSPWLVRIDPTQFHQILLNLCANARDAIPERGRVSITTQKRVLGEPIELHGEIVAPGEWVELSVADSGVGLSEDAREHLFEPFYTTKEFGRGTGLGLASCHGIVRQHGGHLRVESELGRGTTVTVLLPRVAESASDANAARELESRGDETILLVEDESAVRETLTQTLRTFGYTVLDAADGLAALRRVADAPGPIHALITDVVMPSLGGESLARRLRTRDPSLAVLFISGYAASALDASSVRAEGIAFLHKPFTARALASKLRALLDARSRSELPNRESPG